MGTDAPRYPVLVDTDALIAVANSPLWDEIIAHIGLTTTNVCQHELARHREERSPSAPEGSRPYRLHHGSATVLAEGTLLGIADLVEFVEGQRSSPERAGRRV